tara:strand:+ start:261 stop:677 length:417 start_codon:yes stop_codon:yes gene_type:complete
MSNTITLSRNMPQKFSVADGGNSFILGRRAYFNNNFQSHQVQNLGNNNSSTNSKKTDRLKTESGNNPRPLPNKGSDLRIQRLRLSAVGAGSSKLKDANDKVSYKPEDHKNVINNARTRVRGGGAAFVPKPDSIPKSSM